MVDISWEFIKCDNAEISKQYLIKYRDSLKQGIVQCSAFDTETTGLHPIVDVPFLFQCGWVEKIGTTLRGYVLVFDLEEYPSATTWIKNWNNLTEHSPIYLGHHVIFDQHMTENVGCRYKKWDNLSDTQFYIRASSDAVQQDKGGESLALKTWATRHINKDAAKFEHNLAMLRSALAKEYNNILLNKLGCSKKYLNEFFKDKANEWTDLPENYRVGYQEWLDELPVQYRNVAKAHGVLQRDDIRYNDIDRDAVIEYSYYDIVYTLTCYLLCVPVVEVRETYEQIRRENLALEDFYLMERVGFLVDKDYIYDSKLRTKQYLLRRRNDLSLLAGEPLKVSQSKRIVEILYEKFGIKTDSSDDAALQKILGPRKNIPEMSELVEFIETIQELRTLEKWYSTYIRSFELQLSQSDRIYTSINQVGAVSGRVSCNFQQFPKEGLTTFDNQELFDPRRMVLVDKDSGYDSIFYLDYSAQELRIQALWTYLIGSPDEGMLRAYSPYKCHNELGQMWDPENSDMVRTYREHKWFNDDGSPWVKEDLHSRMTHAIYPTLSEDDPSWHDKRYIGKRANFMKNYGGSYQCVRDTFYWLSDEECHAIDEGYYKAFPGVKAYHQWCFEYAKQPYAENIYGVKYYGVNGHHLRNVLVQGSAAYMTKEQTHKVNQYLKDKGYKSRIIIPIHDEIQLEHHKDDPLEIMFELKEIMQDIDSQVPIISDLEVTTTDWKHKVEINNMKELEELMNEQ